MLVIIIAALAGFVSGLGLGGAALLVPAFVLILGIDQLYAQSAGLIGFLPAAVLAIIIHIRKGRLHFKPTVYLILAGLIVSPLGAFLATLIERLLLRKFFGVFLTILGAIVLISSKNNGKEFVKPKKNPD